MDIKDREIAEEFETAQAKGGGTQMGGGPGEADRDAAGGSSGSGGYGNAQNQQLRSGAGDDPCHPARRELSRGERFDQEQGGGRGADSVDFGEELKEDQKEHQDRGQRWTEDDGSLDAGAVTEGQQP